MPKVLCLRRTLIPSTPEQPQRKCSIPGAVRCFVKSFRELCRPRHDQVTASAHRRPHHLDQAGAERGRRRRESRDRASRSLTADVPVGPSLTSCFKASANAPMLLPTHRNNVETARGIARCDCKNSRMFRKFCQLTNWRNRRSYSVAFLAKCAGRIIRYVESGIAIEILRQSDTLSLPIRSAKGGEP
jgi:hypothetical protein